MNSVRRQRWDIFCRVIDNFGDIAVSWRLARQLAREHGITVRLWVDQLDPLRALCPEVDALARQTVDGVEVFAGDASVDALLAGVAAIDGVIEAFGCGLPPRYVDALAAYGDKPLWIILEYLSAESWVREHHGLPSPHPQLNLSRYFYFPGFDADTGGVLCEADLLARRDAFDAEARAGWWQRLGFDAVPPAALAVSLFGYSQAPTAALIDACVVGMQPVVMAVPAGALAERVREHLGADTGHRVLRGNLEVRFLPFLPQAEYDSLLWACDVNFVRGEDSFVRAQWAGQPFVWHIYPQADDAHHVKLDAFLHAYATALDPSAAAAVRDFWHVWNGVAGGPPLVEAWAAFCGTLAGQRRGLQEWQDRLQRNGDLAANLLKFCEKMI